MTFGTLKPRWPLATPPKKWTQGGAFAAHREDEPTDREHQGIDLAAPEGTPVYAVDDGEIVATQGWRGPNTAGLWVDHYGDGYANLVGYSALYGGIRPGSSPAIGTKVNKGDQIGVVGRYPGGSTMLHWEAWVWGTRPPRPTWKDGASQPKKLYDPSEYLARAMDYPNPEQPAAESGGVVLIVLGVAVTAAAAAAIFPKLRRRRR